MSTYLSTFTPRKGTVLTVCVSYCVLSGLFAQLMLLCTFVLSPVASAASKNGTPPEYLARAEVAVVRVVATYSLQTAPPILPTPKNKNKNTTPASATPPPVTCTGLGVVVASWEGSVNEQNAYIMTDGSLVNPKEFTCQSSSIAATPVAGGPQPKFLRLSTIRVYFNTVYNNQPVEQSINNMDSVQCSDDPCSDGVALFSFHSNTPFPVVELPESGSTEQPNAAALQLNASQSQIATPSASSNLQQFLTPTEVPLQDATLDAKLNTFEGGTPIVNSHGFLNGLYAQGGTKVKVVQAQELSAFMERQSLTTGGHHPNPVNDAWQSGMNAYAAGSSQYAQANKLFKQAYSASNSQFQGAQMFAALTDPANQQSSATAPEASSSRKDGINIPFIGFVPYLLLAIGAIGAVVIILLLILLNLLFRRAQRQRDFQEADKQAAIQARQIQEREAQQATASAVPPRARLLNQQSGPYPVQQGVNSIGGASPLPPAPTPAVVGAPVQASALADQPTIDMKEAQRSETMDVDKTQPFTPITPQTPKDGEEHVGFEVIAKTNPGIKRKHKPNEDSMFAIRGIRKGNGEEQQIGLFVVADGMGGHADGRDASRLAIQTIIDFLLPRLAQGEDTRESAEKLLVDSIQLANQAVHQHNVEQNADMGTTVTATLVIDEMAHVANVGDSRTYLYRLSDGLTRVTRDHSVVASLVDAGIIKPDDIYTHPKRNQIYRSLGEKPFVEVDPFTVQLHPGDKLLLCSDGLWEMVRDPEIQHVLEMPIANPQQLGENLISAALKGGGEDNVSVMVINVVEGTSTTSKPGLEPIYVQENINIPSL